MLLKAVLLLLFLKDVISVDITGESGGACKKLRVCGTHGSGKDCGKKNARKESREQSGSHIDEYHALFGRIGQKSVAEILSADNTDKSCHNKNQEGPTRSDDTGTVHFLLGLDGHITNQDVRHSEISKSPAKTGENGQNAVTVEFFCSEKIVSVYCK